MKAKKKLRFLPVLIMLTLVACGEFSLGVIPENPVQPEVETLDSTEAPTANVTRTPSSLPETTPTETTDPFPALVYVGIDGNLWLREAGGENHRQVTEDAQPFDGANPFIQYSLPELSSDALWLAYSREEGYPTDYGFEVKQINLAANLETGEEVQIHEGYLNGLAWKPETHLLAIGMVVDMEYFFHSGEPGSGYATGILAIDLDTGETSELVEPERGYSLAHPNWSGNGRFLAFVEIIAQEGSGNFAYYDFETEKYVAWEEAVGNVSWSPDGSSLTYSRITYVPTGDERLYIHNREGDEMTVGPDFEGPKYPDYPVFSPRGDQIAYAVKSAEPDSWTFTVSVLNVATGEVRELGEFEDVWELAWSPDSRYIVFDFGHRESRQIIAIDVASGEQILLAEGDHPSIAGR